MKRIYFDNNATTALDDEVYQAMIQELSQVPSNPSSIHFFGTQAKSRLSEARSSCARFFNVLPEEILFTSSGTESIHLMLSSIPLGSHLITTEIEHSAVENKIRDLEKKGMQVTFLKVGALGCVTKEQIEEAILPNTKAIVLSLANSETGVQIDLEKIAALAEKKEIALLLDAVGFIGKERLSFLPSSVKALAISGHKFHGPKGSALLVHRKSFPIKPLFLGGGQEYGLRSGTENLPGIVGLTKAIEILEKKQLEISEKILNLRILFETKMLATIPDIVINGKGARISNTTNFSFLGVDGETLLIHLDLAKIAASHGSACSSGAIEPSRVLTSMGIDRKTAKSAIRFSFARTNTKEEIEEAVEIISKIVASIRS